MWDWEAAHAGREGSLLAPAGIHHLPGGGHVERSRSELEAELRLWPDRQGERWGQRSEAGSRWTSEVTAMAITGADACSGGGLPPTGLCPREQTQPT